MSIRQQLSPLKPQLVDQWRLARRFGGRYGKSAARFPQVARAAQASRLDLVPASVDLLAGVVVDVGANVGDWTASVLTVVPRVHILAVEPGEMPLHTLRQRFNKEPRVEVVEAAVSDQTGSATFHITGHSHNSSLQAPRNMNSEYGFGWELAASQTVRTTTLDVLLQDRDVSLIKIDVQGAETKVLEGGRHALARAGAVLLEVTLRSHYEGDVLFPGLHEHMESLGYQLAGLSKPFLNPAGEALWLDACYTRRSASAQAAVQRSV